MHRLLSIAILILLPLTAFAGRLHPESYYQDQWCAEQGGQIEVTVESGARCDCLTATHAIEVDFASKWAEAIGQSLHYASETGKQAGIVLIVEDEDKDAEEHERLMQTIEYWKLPIDVWTVGPQSGANIQ